MICDTNEGKSPTYTMIHQPRGVGQKKSPAATSQASSGSEASAATPATAAKNPSGDTAGMARSPSV